ncbi:MGMT family protein [Candidatus Microgenomates bacterium]|nr:MAG: MGMT family protein [Candidatus Microgenomates bacterium]
MIDRDDFYKTVKKIPKGKVITYGNLAKLTGIKSPRVVGNLLHVNPFAPEVPCHRVVNSAGKLAENFGAEGGKNTQMKRLQAEGVEVIDFRVDLQKFGWVPKEK